MERAARGMEWRSSVVAELACGAAKLGMAVDWRDGGPSYGKWWPELTREQRRWGSAWEARERVWGTQENREKKRRGEHTGYLFLGAGERDHGREWWIFRPE